MRQAGQADNTERRTQQWPAGQTECENKAGSLPSPCRQPCRPHRAPSFLCALSFPPPWTRHPAALSAGPAGWGAAAHEVAMIEKPNRVVESLLTISGKAIKGIR
eukprot:1155885-Pelagomonas_calceolata.AAC.2